MQRIQRFQQDREGVQLILLSTHQTMFFKDLKDKGFLHFLSRASQGETRRNITSIPHRWCFKKKKKIHLTNLHSFLSNQDKKITQLSGEKKQMSVFHFLCEDHMSFCANQSWFICNHLLHGLLVLYNYHPLLCFSSRKKLAYSFTLSSLNCYSAIIVKCPHFH